MNRFPELIVMLTHNDRTVENAREVFDRCKNSKAKFWGFKEEGLPLRQMKELYASMKACGKTTVLEVVAYTEEGCLSGARMAADCGCDFLMGTMFFDSVNEFCKATGLKYMPFLGKITGRPSVLDGMPEDMIREANDCLKKGVYGFDLLGYRHVGDATAVIAEVVSKVAAPVCVAGSVNSYQRLDELKKISPWAFTIGGAFFEQKFGEDFGEQINAVCDHMSRSL